MQVSPEVVLLQHLSEQVALLTSALKQTQVNLGNVEKRVCSMEKELKVLKGVRQMAGTVQGLQKELTEQGKRLVAFESASGRLQEALRAAADSFA